MTVQGAIEIIKYASAFNSENSPLTKALDIGIKAMEEIEQYRALGTVEELKEAIEKQIPKKPNLEGDGYCPEGNLVYDTWFCPNCDKDYEIDYDDYDYCPNCGQAIDKSVFEGSEEDEKGGNR